MRQLELIPAYGHREEIVTLFTEYTNMLMEQDEIVRQYLILQNYEKELARRRKNTACRRGGCIWPVGRAA